jgi:hypothetical protein
MMRRKNITGIPGMKVRPGGSVRSDRSVTDISDTGLLAETRIGDTSVSAELSAGDVDARWDQAESSGEETAGGSSPTPDQDIVDEIGRAIGVTYEEGETLRVGQKEQERDEHRWELDPASAEDYGERSAATNADSETILKMQHRDQYRRSGGDPSGQKRR